jgi:beta-glucosidase
MDNYTCKSKGNSLTISLTIENTGDYDGAEVVQIYLSGRNCDVVMPILELKAYKRIELLKGEKKNISIEVPAEAFFYYDRKMVYGMHNGDHKVSVRTSSRDICAEFDLKVRHEEIIN